MVAGWRKLIRKNQNHLILKGVLTMSRSLFNWMFFSVFTLFSFSLSAANLDNPNWSYSSFESFDSTLFIDGYSLSPSGGTTTASMSTNIGIVNSGDALEFSAFVLAFASFIYPQSDVMIRDNLFINAGVKITGSSDEIVYDLSDGGLYDHNYYFGPDYTPEWMGFMIDYETYSNPVARAQFLEEQGMSLDDVVDPWEAEMLDILDSVVDLTPLTGQDAQLSFFLQASTSGFYDEVLFVDMTIDSYGINNTNPVPVPAAAWLFGSALAGLGVMRRKK